MRELTDEAASIAAQLGGQALLRDHAYRPGGPCKGWTD